MTLSPRKKLSHAKRMHMVRKGEILLSSLEIILHNSETIKVELAGMVACTCSPSYFGG
jgi:hypothetical protein